MILALDVETSGLPARGIEIGNDQYPWPVQVGAVLFGFDGHDRAVIGSRVRAPDGKKITDGAVAVHGITSREAARSGIPELLALSLLCNLAAESAYVVGFNLSFDLGILESAIIRNGKDTSKLIRSRGVTYLDLMRPAAAFCKLQGPAETGEYRWPRLDIALQTIRNERPRQGHHDALHDAMAAKRLFLSLHHRGAFEIARAA
jgi:DNA polymerase III epsilon subunit-like protein